MKLSKRAALILACTALAATNFVGCKGDDDSDGSANTGDGDGDTAMGDGDGDTAMGDGDGDTPMGDGDGDTSMGDGDGPTSPYQCDEAGGAQCTGSASGIVCADGTTDGVPFTCAQGEECVDGACEGICDPGAMECVGGAVQRICTADGRSWVNVPCQEGTVCEDGACGLEGGLVCVPGTMDCDGNTARTCMDDGSGWDEMECPDATVCEEGACEGTVCTVGATRCDASAVVRPEQFFEALDDRGEPPPPSTVIQTCVDGQSWVTTACASSDDTQQVCSYTNIDHSVAANYRAEVNAWFLSLYAGGPEQLANAPTPPMIPKSARAECVTIPDDESCGELGMEFFESPAALRQCVDTDGFDPAVKGDYNEYYKGYSECQGFLPFAPLEVVETPCGTGTGCFLGEDGEEQVRGCQAARCLPGETLCSDEGDTTFETCVYGPTPELVFFDDEAECPDDVGMGGVAPATCTDGDQSVGSRAVSCGPTEIEGEQIFFESSSIEEVPIKR